MDPAAIGELVDRYGLPLALIILEGFVVWRGWIIVRGGAADRAERSFLEQLRQEERVGRLTAEERLAKVVETVAPALVDLKKLVGELEREITRAGRRGDGR